MIAELAARIRKAGKVLLIGNGGSYANSVHIANDLISCGIPAYTMDIATFSALSNDFGHFTAFSKWISVCGKKGDLLIALSGSGKSKNILNACEAAERIGMDVHREFGAAQGYDMQRAEEQQIWLGHELLRCLRQKN